MIAYMGHLALGAISYSMKTWTIVDILHKEKAKDERRSCGRESIVPTPKVGVCLVCKDS